MTIQEAIKSGKPFTRKAWRNRFNNRWVFITPLDGGLYYQQREAEEVVEMGTLHLSAESVLADDWEVKP